MRHVRSSSIMVLALTGAMMLAGCAKEEDSTRTLNFWTIGREGQAVEKLLPEFEREHPGLHVSVQQLPLTAAHQKLLTAFAGNSTPDLTQLGNTWVAEMAALEAIEPLQSRVDASKIIQPDDYFPSIWATNVIDGTLYGVPWYVDTRLLFYRKDLLAKAGYDHPPRDWAQWRTMMARLSQPVGTTYGVLLPTNEFEQLLSLVLQQDDAPLRDNNRYGNFRSAGFKRALTFYVDTFKQHQAPLITNVGVGNPWAAFGQGYYTFYLSGPWNIGEFRKRLPAEQQKDWSTTPLPGPNGPGASNAGGSSLVIFRASRHKDDAWALVEFLSRPDIQARFYEILGDMPPRRSSWEKDALRNDPEAAAFRDQLERVKPTPPIPEWERIVTEMQLLAAEAASGKISVDDAATELDRRTDAILEKRRWILDHPRSNEK
ncbi:multiple sugar transport system substrate-binding protein [Luteibacter sp. Sphag1AF]|uniref:sugar ABC transporter substrate-binding protein n=1 Tax=Luteibacter sp. Sphag1AF TaxID=2587031 RepID=UPI00160D64D7|nr:sugar ABC transporter substrate-binding protein [Luteibacter sp. Sphag1AF]MBB3226672.1 multiple sugar transport system substrate-binding protein [Luteibacter sp. Sphag1AF]